MLSFVDVSLHSLHPEFIRKDNHHSGVSVVWQHDDASVVTCILIEVVVNRPHHVNLNFGTAVNVEVVLMCPFSNKWFLLVSCTTQWRVVLTILGFFSLSAVSINLWVQVTTDVFQLPQHSRDLALKDIWGIWKCLSHSRCTTVSWLMSITKIIKLYVCYWQNRNRYLKVKALHPCSDFLIHW